MKSTKPPVNDGKNVVQTNPASPATKGDAVSGPSVQGDVKNSRIADARSQNAVRYENQAGVKGKAAPRQKKQGEAEDDVLTSEAASEEAMAAVSDEAALQEGTILLAQADPVVVSDAGAGSGAVAGGSASAAAAGASATPWGLYAGAALGALAVGGGVAVVVDNNRGSDSSKKDATPPDAPTLALAGDTGSSASDGITSSGVVNVSDLEAGGSWQYSTDGGATWTAGTGSSFTVSGDGAKSVLVRQADAAGNVSASGSLDITLDTAAPEVQGFSVAGNQVVLTYNEALDGTNIPPANAFNVTVGGTPNVVTNVAVAGTTVTLTLTSAVPSGSAVTVSYSDLAGDNGNAIQDAAGNDAASVSTGVVSDGYIRGAQIYIDTDGQGDADAGELTSVTTDARGQFILPANASAGAILAVGGINIDTNVPNTLLLKAPAGSTIVSPLTTLVQAIIESNPGTSVTAATNTVVNALGLTDGTDLTTYDPVAALTANSGDATALAVQKAAVQVATLVAKAAEAPAGGLESNVAAAAVITNLATQINSASVTIDLADAAVVTEALGTASVAVVGDITAATTAIAAATTLTEISNKQAQALDTIEPATPSTVLAAASDSGTSSTDGLTNDTTPTLRVSFNTSATDGTAVLAGDTVTVLRGAIVATVTLTSTDIANGYVDVTLSPSVMTEGENTFTATITDAFENESLASAALTIALDTTAPTAPTVALTIDSGSGSDLITNAGTLSVTGTETGATLQYSTDGGETWSNSFTASEGANAVQVRQVDAAGNAGEASSSLSFTLDTTAAAPTVALATDSGSSGSDGITNVGTLNVTGTESGATIQYSTNGGETWSSTFAAAAGANTVLVRQTDIAGNASTATSRSFTLDTAAPTLSSSTPADDATNVTGNSIVLTFSENVAAATGNIVLSDGTESTSIAIGDTSQVAISGNTITITPSTSPSPNTSYGLTMGSGVITDVAGNVFAGISAGQLDFTMANNPGVTIGTNDSALKIGESATLTFTLSEASTNFTAADVTVTGGTLSGFSGSGTTYTATFTPNTNSTASGTVSVGAGTFTNAAGLNNLAASPLILAVDTVAPTLSSSTPADNATSVAPGNSIVLTFSENMAVGTGNIVISDGGGDVRTIAVTDSTQVTVSGTTATINPTADLNPSSTYFVQMASGVVTDAAGNAYAGLSDTITLNFATASAPSLSTTLGGVTNLDPRSNLVLSVSEDVTWAEGVHTITITNLANGGGKDGFRTESTANTQTITVTADASGEIVSISGGTVTVDNTNNKIVIDPAFDLDLSNNYSLSVSTGAFQSLEFGTDTVALTPVSFSTVTPGLLSGGQDAAALSQIMNTSTGATEASLRWLDVTNPADDDPSSGTYQNFDAGSFDFSFVVKDMDSDPNDITVTDTYIQFNNFGAGDLIYLDNQLNQATTQQWVSENVFSGGVGTSGDPFSVTMSGTSLASSINVVVETTLTLPSFTDALVTQINSNSWSNTGIIVGG